MTYICDVDDQAAAKGVEAVGSQNPAPKVVRDFRKALELDPNVRRQFEPSTAAQPGRGQRLRAILEDREFLKQLFPDQVK